MTKVKQRRVITTLAAPAPEPTSTSAAARPAAAGRRNPASGSRAKDVVAPPRSPSPRPVAAVATAAPRRVPRGPKVTVSGPRTTSTATAPSPEARVARRKEAARPDAAAPGRIPRRAAAARTAAAVSRPAIAPAVVLAAVPTVVKKSVGGRSSAPVRGKKVAVRDRGMRPAAPRSTKSPSRAATPTKAGRRGATARGKRPVPPKAPLPREIFIKALDPLRKCGPNTSVLHMFRVDESLGGAHAATHLVFYDRHGWYCVHGRTCQAVEDVRKHGGVKQVGLDYNGRMRA